MLEAVKEIRQAPPHQSREAAAASRHSAAVSVRSMHKHKKLPRLKFWLSKLVSVAKWISKLRPQPRRLVWSFHSTQRLREAFCFDFVVDLGLPEEPGSPVKEGLCEEQQCRYHVATPGVPILYTCGALYMLAQIDLVVSQNRGTPMQTPKYYNPYYRDPQKGTPNFGKPPLIYLHQPHLASGTGLPRRALLWTANQPFRHPVGSGSWLRISGLQLQFKNTPPTESVCGP